MLVLLDTLELIVKHLMLALTTHVEMVPLALLTEMVTSVHALNFTQELTAKLVTRISYLL